MSLGKGCGACGGIHSVAAVNNLCRGIGSLDSPLTGFQSHVFCIPILSYVFSPLIPGGSRMRRRACTDLCGGRSANDRPYRVVIPIMAMPKVWHSWSFKEDI